MVCDDCGVVVGEAGHKDTAEVFHAFLYVSENIVFDFLGL